MIEIDTGSFIGDWSLIKGDKKNAIVTIEKTNETYKCSWRVPDDLSKKFIRLGMLVGNEFLVARIEQKDNSGGLPIGGIGVYRPIGDKRSNCALWTNMQQFDTLGAEAG